MNQPNKLPQLPPKLNYAEFLQEITAAHRALAALDALLGVIPNPKILERSFVTKEAVLSSRIEGTVADVDEVLDYDAGAVAPTHQLQQDIAEITNYRMALALGLEMLEEQPISENFIKKLHGQLLESGRGGHKDPGNFRRVQVYIGSHGQGIENASYIPPVAPDIILLIKNLLMYIHEQPENDELVRIAVAHYQFEAIHPFLDGNGRVGRLLISLLLKDKNLLRLPYLYISQYFEQNRQGYYEGLLRVSENGDWSNWIRYFLNGVRWQAQEGTKSAQLIVDLNRALIPQMASISSEYGLETLRVMFETPIFTASILREQASIDAVQTSYSLIERMLADGIIADITPEKQRNKRYEFRQLLNIIRGGM